MDHNEEIDLHKAGIVNDFLGYRESDSSEGVLFIIDYVCTC